MGKGEIERHGKGEDGKKGEGGRDSDRGEIEGENGGRVTDSETREKVRMRHGERERDILREIDRKKKER